MEQEAIRTLFSSNKANEVYNAMVFASRNEWQNVIPGKFTQNELRGASQRMTKLAVILLEMSEYLDAGQVYIVGVLLTMRMQ